MPRAVPSPLGSALRATCTDTAYSLLFFKTPYFFFTWKKVDLEQELQIARYPKWKSSSFATRTGES